MGQSAAQLTDLLARHKKVGLDSVLFIYHLAGHPDYLPLTRALFTAIEKGHTQGIISPVCLVEVLPKPLAEGNQAIAADVRDFLLSTPHINVVPLDADIAETAASLRARYRLTTPDAIHIATAIRGGATAFVTNDKKLRRVKDIPIIVLADLIDSSGAGHRAEHVD